MATTQEIENLLRANGVDVEAVARDLDAEIEAGRMDNAGAMDALNDLYEYYYSKNQKENKSEDTTQAVQTEENKNKIGLARGIAQTAENAFLANAGSIVHGAMNVPAVQAAVAPLGYVAKRFLSKSEQPELVDISKAPQQYKEGAESYSADIKQFEKEHPTAATWSNIGGTVGSFLLPIGRVAQGVKGTVGGAKLVKALANTGKLGAVTGKLLPRIAGEMAGFGAYETIKKGTEAAEPGGFNIKEGARGAYQGAGVGGIMALAGGAAGEIEKPLIEKAMEMGGNPLASKLLGKVLTSTVEGLGIGVAPAVMEGRLPTEQEFKSGVRFALGVRAVAEGASRGAMGLRELSQKTTYEQKRDMVIARRGTKALETAREKAALDTEESMRARQELADKTTELFKETQKLEKDLEKATTEAKEGLLNKINENKTKIGEELSDVFDEAQRDVTSMAYELGWKLPKAKDIKLSDKYNSSRYIELHKGNRVEMVRLSGHDATGPREDQFIHWDIRKSADENLRNLYDKLIAEPVKSAVKGATVVNEDEINKFLKEYPGSTRKQAEIHIKDYKTAEAIRNGANTRNLSLGEKALRAYQGTIEWGRTKFNLIRPITRAIETTEKLTGVKVPYSQRADYTLNKLNNGGEVEAFIRPIAEEAKSLKKKSPAVLLDADKINKLERIVSEERREGVITSKSLDALREIEEFKGSKYAHQLANKVKEKLQEGLDILYKSGRLSKEFYEELKARKDYVPLKAILEEDSLIYNEMQSGVEQSLRAYKGNAQAYENSILSSLNLLKSEFRFGEIQKAKKQYIASAKQIGEAKLVPTKEYKGGKIEFDPKKHIVIWEGGQPQVWEVPNGVARLFNPEKMPDRSKLYKMAASFAGWPMRFFKGGTTAASGGFVISNLPRDYTSAVIMSENGAYIGPSEIREAGADILSKKPIVDALRKEQGGQTIVASYGLPELAEDNLKDIVKMYEAAPTAFADGTQRNALARTFVQALGPAAKKFSRFASGTNKTVLEGLTFAGNLSEETTRLAVFKNTLRKLAKDENQYKMFIEHPETIPADYMAKAGNEAREVTLNFRRPMHPWIEWTNRYAVPYFKPAILGAMRGFEALTSPDIAPRAWRYLINLGVLQGIVKGRMADEETTKQYEAINNEIVGKTFTLTGDSGRPYTFPIAQELAPVMNFFGLLTEKVYRHSTKEAREDINNEIKQSLKDMAANYIPGVGTVFSSGNYVPQPIKVFAEQAWNKDTYTGVPIESDAQKKKLPHLRYTVNTSPTLVKVADMLAKRGIEVSPLRMQHAIKAIGSNTAKEMLSLTDSIGEQFLWTDLRPNKDISDNPILRRTVPNLYAPYGQLAIDAREIVARTKPAYDLIEEQGDAGLSKKQAEEYFKNAYIYSSVETYWKDVEEIYKQRTEALKEIDEAGKEIRERYNKKEISRQDALYEQDQVLKIYDDLLDFYNKQELDLMWNIVKAANEAKKEYEKAPK